MKPIGSTHLFDDHLLRPVDPPRCVLYCVRGIVCIVWPVYFLLGVTGTIAVPLFVFAYDLWALNRTTGLELFIAVTILVLIVWLGCCANHLYKNTDGMFYLPIGIFIVDGLVLFAQGVGVLILWLVSLAAHVRIELVPRLSTFFIGTGVTVLGFAVLNLSVKACKRAPRSIPGERIRLSADILIDDDFA